MNLKYEFKKAWISIEIPGVRESEGTYFREVYESLPTIEIPLHNLGWLNSTEFEIDVNQEGECYRLEKKERQLFQENWVKIKKQARDLQLTFPVEFLELMESFTLQDCLLSCTACYFDLPDRISESLFREGDYILRFYNDSQCCVCWYLYFSQSGDVSVIASSGTEDSPFLEDVDESSIESAQELTHQVSSSFLEFIYRFWIENHIWFKLYEKGNLSSQELAYIRHYQPNYIQ